jgi:phytoene/squalene synthetase
VILPRKLTDASFIDVAILVRRSDVTETGSDDSDEEEIYCEFVANLVGCLLMDPWPTETEKLVNGSRARSLAETQKWCVG